MARVVLHMSLSERARRNLASALAITSVVPLVHEAMDQSNVPVVAWLALTAPVFAALLLQIRRLEPQLLARSMMWAALIFGTLGAWVADTNTAKAHAITLTLTFASGLALIALGTLGLEDRPASRVFVPIALRGVVLAVVVMALADTFSLLFWGGVIIEEGAKDMAAATFFSGAGAAMLIAVYGLYRLKVWGFALNVGANIAIAGGAWLVPNMPNELALCLTMTAVAQLAVGLPLVRGLANGKAVSLSPKLAKWVGSLTILGLLTSVVVARALC